MIQNVNYNFLILIHIFTLVNTLRKNSMDRENCGKMMEFTEDISKITKKMECENSLAGMDIFIRYNGLMGMFIRDDWIFQL